MEIEVNFKKNNIITINLHCNVLQSVCGFMR